MDLKEDILGSNSIEDVIWLCQLSESELDFLMSLKSLVVHRAKVIRREELAEKFDLKMLRAIGVILLEHVKGKLKESCVDPPNSTNFAESLDESKLTESYSPECCKCRRVKVTSPFEFKEKICRIMNIL